MDINAQFYAPPQNGGWEIALLSLKSSENSLVCMFVILNYSFHVSKFSFQVRSAIIEEIFLGGFPKYHKIILCENAR